MPQDDSLANGKSEESTPGTEEARSLLSYASNDNDNDKDEDDDIVLTNDLTNPSSLPPPRPPPAPGLNRQSSLVRPSASGQQRTPRTPNRVRFDIDEELESLEARQANGHVAGSPLWLQDEDSLDGGRRASTGQRAPLLTDITPPSASPFLSDSFQPEDHLPNARPKSGMRNAFMNMANSIIGAGIIGQPYALRQAGLTMGILLLIGLTVVVDWTIRLIIINSKLSGADSFQATMHHCFGKSGLVAISIAQWAFAFGGMVAFCVIIGDTIPHVLEAIIPGLRNMSFLWLLTDRRAIIVLFVLGVSWPLSLYRDIAKVRPGVQWDEMPCFLGGFADESFIASESIDFGVDQHVGDHYHDRHARRAGSL